MNIPRGNILFEDETLNYNDISIMMQNLEQQGFTGYIRIDQPGSSGLLFFNHGSFMRAMATDQNHCQLDYRTRLVNLTRDQETPVSVYVLSPQMVSVLSASFSFENLYMNIEAKKKELKKVKESLEQEEQSGMLEVISRDGTSYALVDRGKVVYDNFTNEYGQIHCGAEENNRCFEQKSREEAYLNVYGQKQTVIESLAEKWRAREEQARQLQAKGEKSGIMGGSDEVVKLDENLIKEWTSRGASANAVEIETSTGRVTEPIRCQPGKRLAQQLSIPIKLLQRLGIQDGEALLVRPAG
ncbi:MAG: hypothetical protein ACYCW6_30215 [Candidatus Xenobia bacterium]